MMKTIIGILLFVLLFVSCDFAGQLPPDLSRETLGEKTDFVKVTDVVAGPGYSLAVRAGELWSWGKNDVGQLGLGDAISDVEIPLPAKVDGISDVVSVSTGDDFSLALTESGQVWSWGKNDVGQLGLGGNANAVTADTVSTPTRIEALADIELIQAGSNFALALDAAGNVWSWGNNDHGQLGLGGNTPPQPDGEGLDTPQTIENFTDVALISAGAGHVLAKKQDDTAWSWGNNDRGQLGLGGQGNQNIPRQITITDVDTVHTGSTHSAIITKTGAMGTTLYLFGDNKYMQLGNGDSALPSSDVPTALSDTVVAGEIQLFHTSESNNFLIFADGDREESRIWGRWRGMIYPNPATPPFSSSDGMNVVKLQSSIYHLLIIDGKGILWVMGDNDYSVLGLPEANIQEARKNIPKPVIFE